MSKLLEYSKIIIDAACQIKPVRDNLKKIPIVAPYIHRFELKKMGLDWNNHDEFIKAVKRKDTNIVIKFLECGLNVNAQNAERETGLIAASEIGDKILVGLFLAIKGTKIDVTDTKNRTAIIVAALNDHDEIVKLLRDHKVSEEGLQKAMAKKMIKEKNYEFTKETFLRLVEFNHLEDVKNFLMAGMYPAVFDEDHNTALIIASANDYIEIVNLLLNQNFLDRDQRKEFLNTKNKFNHTAIIAAAINDHDTIVGLLQKSGASTEGLREMRLLEAAKKGDEIEVQKLLDEGVDINYQDRYWKKTPLMIAAEHGHEDIVELLIKKAKVNEQDKDGSTALILSAWNGHRYIVKMLIDSGAEVNITDNAGRTALMGAIYNNDRKMEMLLINANASLQDSPKANLLDASRQGNLSKVKDLLVGRPDMHIKDHEGNTPLILAAAKGHKDIVTELLTVKSDKTYINIQNKKGNTALMEAARFGHVNIIEKLFNYEAEIDATNSFRESALILASSEAHTNVVKWLINNGADVNIATKDGSSAFSIACAFGFPDIVQLLIKDKKIKVDTQIKYGYSPYMLAALAGHNEIVSLLKVKAKRGINESELFLAIQDGDERRVNDILSKEVDLSAKDIDGSTALIKATEEGYENIAKILIDHDQGAEILARDRYGKIPLSIAASRGFVNLLSLFIQKLTEKYTKEEMKKITSPVLLVAARSGNAAATRLLIEEGNADINFHARNDDTPLIFAAYHGHYEVIRTLLTYKDKGLNINETGRNGITAWMAAYLNGHNEIAGMLAEEGANIGIVEAKLIEAAKSDDVEAIDWIENHISEVRDILLNIKDREGITPLMWACKKGKLKAVKMLLESDVEVAPDMINKKADNGKTALMFACEKGVVRIVKELLSVCTNESEKEEVIDAESKEKRTALMEACKNGYLPIVRLILDNLRQEVKAIEMDKEDNYGNTPIKEALFHGHQKIVEYLLNEGATNGKREADFLQAAKECDLTTMERMIAQHVDIDVKGENGKTSLIIVSELGCEKGVAVLIRAGANIELLDRAHETALIKAAKEGYTSIVTFLLDKGNANPNGGIQHGKHALIETAREGHVGIAKKLLSKGAHVNIRGQEQETALIAATKEQRIDMVEYLCNLKKIDKEAEDIDGKTPLMIAHLKGNLTHISEKDLKKNNMKDLENLSRIEKILLNKGARKGWNEAELLLATSDCDDEFINKLLDEDTNVHARDLDNNTPLLIAAQKGCSKVLYLLIEKGANLNVRNKENRTPLMEAAREKHADIVKTLIRSVEVDTIDNNENTALLEASAGGALEVVKLLIEAKANVDKKNKDGETPLIVASRKENPKLVKYLINNGADILNCSIKGRNSLMEASEKGHREVLKTLLEELKEKIGDEEEFRKEIHNVDIDDKTALDLANDNEHQNCSQLLKEFGALERNDPNIDIYIPNPRVWVAPFGTKYHKIDCSYLNPNTKKSKTKKQAKLENYEPCTHRCFTE